MSWASLYNGSNRWLALIRHGLALAINCNHHKLRARYRVAIARCKSLSLNLHFNSHGCVAGANRLCIQVYDIANVHRALKNHLVECGSDPPVCAMRPRFNEPSLVDIAQNDTAENCAIVIGISWQRGNTERKTKLRCTR